MRPTRILLADDHPLIVEGFRNLLESQYEIVGAVTDGKALLEQAANLKPDLILLDITLPQLNGIDAARRIRKILPHTKLLFVTMHVNPAYLNEGLNAGGTGYVLKSSAREEILEAIETVLLGQVYITPSLVAKGFKAASRPVQ
jgi:DNA-binding NarL/FixJ family response regulator